MTEALDNLGRKIKSANMSVEELRSLVGSLMKSKVGPAKPLSSLTEKEETMGEKGIDLKPLVSLFEKYVKDHKQDVDEQIKIIEEIKSLIDQQKKLKESKKEPKESKEENENNNNNNKGFAEKAILKLQSLLKGEKKQGEIISDSTEGLYKVFSKKGSGYTHDIYCEKWLQQIYDILTKISDKLKIPDIIKTQDILKEIKDESFAKSFKKVIPETIIDSKPDSERVAPRAKDTTVNPGPRVESNILYDYLDYSDNSFTFKIENLGDAADLLLNFRKIFSKDLTSRQEEKWAGSWTTRIDDVVRYYKKQFKVGTDQALKLEDVLKDQRFKETFDKIGNKRTETGDLTYDASLVQKSRSGMASEEEEKELVLFLIEAQSRELKRQGNIQRRNNQITRELLNTRIELLNELEKEILGFNILEKLLDGIVSKERQFIQDIRAAAFETAGVTGESEKLQRVYEKIGKTVFLTGVSRDKFQESFKAGLKAGIRDQKKLNSLVTAQLNTEKQIGVEAGSLGEQFIEYSNSLKLNETQISAVGRGIREVGKNSGVVGDKLKEAVTSSKQFVDQMKKAGTVTAAAMSNVTGLQAEFNKLGVDGQKVMTALSSSTGFFEADNQTISLIAQAAGAVGLVNQAQAGVILQNKEMMKSMSYGFKDLANRMGLAGESLADLRSSLSKMSDFDKMAINLRMKAAYGVEANEFLMLIEGFENSSKTLSDKLKELNKEKQKNLTLEERTTVLEQERSAKLSASLGVLTGLSEAAKDTATMGEALSMFSRRRRDFEKDINALGYSWTSEIDVARSSLKTSISNLNEGLKQVGKKELSISTSDIEKALKDQTAFRDLVAQIEKGEKELATAQKTQLDPLSRMDQTLLEINDNIRNMSQGLISGVFNSAFGKLFITLVALAAGIASGISVFDRNQQKILNATGFFRKPEPGSDGLQEPISFIKKAFLNIRDFLFGQRIEPTPIIPAVITPAASVTDGEKTTDVVATVQNKAAQALKGETPSTSESSYLQNIFEVNKSMLEVLGRIASCVCDAAKDTSPVDKAEKSAGESVKKDRFTPQERKAKLQEIKNIKADKKLNEMEKKVRIKEVLSGKVQIPKEAGFDLKSLISSGAAMAKSAAGIMLLAAGAVALAAAIVFLSDKIIGAFNLDFNKIVQIAATVGALAAAGASITAAGFGAYKLLTDNKENNDFPKISDLLSTKIASQVAALLVLGPALVLLGATVVKMSQMIVGAFGLDMTTVAQTAGTVTAVVAAAGALTLAASEALEGLEKLNDNKLLKRPEGFGETIWKAIWAILKIGPLLVLLGAAIIKFSQFVLGVTGLSATKIGMITGRVAALISGAGVIAGSIAGAMFGLYGLGLLDGLYQKNKKIIGDGAKALMLFAPLITLLAAALNIIIGGVLSVTGVDAGKAAKVAYDVAALIASTGLIAGAVIGALVGLWGLGTLAAAVTGPQVLAIFGGAAALMLLTPAVMMLASALVNMIKGILATREIDASTAAKTAMQVAGIIGAAGAIALSVMAAMGGLLGLGTAAWWFASPANIALVALGAASLYALTPVVLSLASSIINMAGSIAGNLIGQEEIKRVTEGVSSILGAAAQISLSILASVAGLSILGLFFASAMLAIPLMWLGTRAFNALINPIVNFIGAVKEASNKIGSIVNPSEAKSMSEGISSILQSVGDITKNIASTATSMASFPKYGSFWNWLVGSTIADRMNDGVNALLSLAMPVMRYMGAIALFSRMVGRTVDTKNAKPMAEGVGGILEACASITKSIAKSADSLKDIKKYQGIFDWLRGGIAGMANRGVEALKALMEPIKSYVKAIKSFSSDVGNIISPQLAIEMGQGIANILCSAGGVAQAILLTKDNLSSVKSKEWGWFGTNYVKQMENGASSLEKLSKPVISYVSAVKKFSKRLGKTLNPKKAASMACGVAEIISSTGAVTDSILETKEKLSKIKTKTGWGWFKKDYVKRSNEGVAALKQLSSPIINYVETIEEFSRSVGSKLNVRQAASMAKGVADIFGATGDVTDKIISTKDKLISIKSSEGFWLWATDIPKSMAKGVKALNDLKQPLIDYVVSIVAFSTEVGNKIKPADSQKAAKSLNQVASIVEVFSCVLNDLQNKINPLTKKGWFVDSPISEMTKAKGEMERFFPVLTGFVQSIVKNVNGSFENIGELKKAVKNLGLIAQIFQSVGDTTSTIKEKIIPVTTSGWFKSSDVDSIKTAIPLFNGFFEEIRKFITDGLVGPISKIEDGSILRESAKKLPVIAQLLKEATDSIASLQSMMDLTTGGFFSSSPMKKIADNKGKFASYFAGISEFLNSGIVDPIKKITGLEGLIEAKDKLKDVGCFIYGVKLTLEGLSGIFSLMESDSVFKKSPLENIKINKDELAKYINTAKDFILSGLLAPSLSLPKEEINIASESLNASSLMISKVPVVIKGLAQAVGLATDKDDFFGETPMKKIVDSKKEFSNYFKEIAAFVRDGIVTPVQKELEGVDLAGSSKIMSSMANIVSSTVPIIKNLTNVMGMMSGEKGENLDESFAIDKILLYKDLFADYFKKISIFLRDGIMIPVKEIFPDIKGIREASSTLSAMNNIVSTVPKVILGMSKGFVPLVESADVTKDTPMEAIINSKETFAQWFKEIAEFLRVGVIDPINNKIGDSKEIRKAGSSLSAMSSVIGSMTNIIKNLAHMFAGLNERECLKQAPAELIASQIEKFSGWFYDIISFLKLGIINPVNSLVPDAKELDGVRGKLKTLTASMSAIPEMFDELGGSISLFSKGFLWRIINGFKISKLSKNFISMANIINEGIVKPIQKFLPSSEELSEVNNQLTEFIMIIEKVASTMGLAGRAFLGIKPIDLSGVSSMKEGLQKVSDPGVFEVEVQRAIRGKTQTAINIAEEQATAAAIAALSDKTGKTSLSGVEVDTQIDMEKKIVKAVAKWSKENHDEALGIKKSMEEMSASAGGPGRSAIKLEPAQAATSVAKSSPIVQQATKPEPAQAATSVTKSSPVVQQATKPEPAQAAAATATQNAQQTIKTQRPPISVEAMETYNFNDPVDAKLAMEDAQNLAKSKILDEIQKITGQRPSLQVGEGRYADLIGLTFKNPKYSWNQQEEEGTARITAEYNWGENVPKFAEGGIVNKATLGVIGEAGPEAVVPLSGIEKYSSGIISALYGINSTLNKILSQITKGGKKTFVSSISRGEAGSFDENDKPITNSVLKIGKDALSVGLGVAMAPALSKMLDSFKESMGGFVKGTSKILNKKMPGSNLVSEESGVMGISKKIGDGLFSIMPPNPADCCGAVADSAKNFFGYLRSYLPESIVDRAKSAFEAMNYYSNKAFNGMSSYFSSSFAPLTKGFTRSMNEGQGIFKSLSRGITSQYMSMTRGKSLSELAQGSLDQIKNSGIKAFSYISNKIPQSIKDNAAKAFVAIKDTGSKTLSNVGSYLSSSFAPLTKGFTRSMKSGAGVFQSVSRGITSQYMSITKGRPISEIAKGAFDQIKDNATKAFATIKNAGGKALSSVGGYLSSSFAPLTKGFTRSMESGAGVFQSVSRGITSQYMSMTKGKPISEIAKGALDQVKNGGVKAFNYISSNIPQSWKENATKAFSSVGNYASKAFSNMSGFFSSSFAPLIKGFTRSMEAGEGVFNSISRGITSQFMSLTKGKPISEIANNAFSGIKDLGKKGISVAGGALKGIREKTQVGLKSAGGVVKSLFSKKSGVEGGVVASGVAPTAMSPVENVKKVGEAGSSVKGNFEGVKEALKNLAEGLKSFANKESFLGALNLIPTGIGLTAMIPGFLGAKLIEKMNGKKVQESLAGLSEGLKSMASGKVLLGAAAILISSIGLLGLLPALPGLAILGAMSSLVTAGLTALSVGLTTFGTAAANPLMWLGILAIAGLGAALIPLGYALSTLSPLITAFGTAVGTVLGGISGIITAVAAGMVSFLGAVSLEKAAGLVGIAGGLVVLSGAILAFSAATAAAGWVSFFGGNSSTLDNIVKLADAGPNLNTFAQALTTITGALSEFEASLGNIDGIESSLNRLIQVAINLGAVAPMLEILSSLPAVSQVATPTATVESIAVQENQTRQMAPTNFKSQFTDEWSEKYHPAPVKDVESSLASAGVMSGAAVSTVEGSLATSTKMGIISPVESLASVTTQNIPGQTASVGGGLQSDPMLSEFINMSTKGKGILVRMALPSTDLFESIGDSFGSIMNTVGSTASSVFGSITSVFGSISSVIISALSAVFIGIPSMIVKGLASVGSAVLAGLKAVFITIPKAIGGFLLRGLKAIFIDAPKMLGGLLIKGLKAVFVDAPKMLGGLLIRGLQLVFVNLPSMVLKGLVSLGSLFLSGLEALFISLPLMLGNLLITGLKAVFIDLPLMIGGLIISGIKAVFVDLPVWLGSTILNGITSLMGAIPSAIYNALYSAASMVGLGWVVKKMAGAGAAVKETASKAVEGAKSVASNAVQGAKSTVSGVGSSISSAGASLWSGLQSLLGFGPSAMDEMIPIMSEFFKAGLSGGGILVRHLESGAASTTTPAQTIESGAVTEIADQARKITPTSFKSQFTDEWSEKYHPAPVENLSGSLSSPESIKHIDEVVSGKNLSYGSIKESHIGNAMPGPGLESAVPSQVESVRGGPSTNVPVSVSTASTISANKANIEQKLMKEKATLTPQKSEITSPELGALTSETEEQTEVLNQMKRLFEQFLELLKPKSSPSSSSGGEPGSTIPQNVVGKPTNYYRRVSGNLTQTPGRATVNLGAKSVS